MNYDRKKIISVIVVVCLLLLILILFSVLGGKENKNLKSFKQYDYVYSIDSDYMNDYVSAIPQINVLSEDVNNINLEITNMYFSSVIKDLSSYNYYYGVYNNYLTLMIEINTNDESEYGKIQYYGYYVDLNTGNVISSDELLSYLGIMSDSVDKIIKNKYLKYYNNDSLKNTLSFSEYYNIVNGSSEMVFLIRDNSLFCYKLFNYTHDIIENESYGNIYENFVTNLDA